MYSMGKHVFYKSYMRNQTRTQAKHGDGTEEQHYVVDNPFQHKEVSSYVDATRQQIYISHSKRAAPLILHVCEIQHVKNIDG